MKFKTKSENIVVSADFGVRMDLIKLSSELEDAEYSPEQFPGLVYRIRGPKASFLIFSSGKVNCTGASSIEKAEDAIAFLLKKFKSLGIDAKKPEIKVQNIVSSVNLGQRLNLNKILMLDNIEFEPEQFPGVVYRAKDFGVVFLVFTSGKLIVSGGNNQKTINAAVKDFIQKLDKIGAIAKEDSSVKED